MSFKEDYAIEENFYKTFFKQYLLNKGFNLIWIYYDEENIIHKELQKKNDIDLIIDNGKKNISLSLKTVNKIYENIFFETISNCNINTLGWGYYSKADYIIYTMGYENKKYKIYKFKTNDILNNLDLENYKIGYGYTGNLYKTEGRLIPLKDFKHEIIYEL